MVIDKSGFLFLVGTLAVGGGAGYVVAKQGVSDRPEPLPPPASPAASTASTGSAAAPAAMTATDALPPCDDREGTPGTCPPAMYSADESGGCGSLPSKRCTDFKESMKPKAAERAVACLNSLKAGERCDANRINLCGHIALMGACVERAVVPPAQDDVGASCKTIVDGCAGAVFTPTLRDCRATLAGMTDSGRMHAVDCMKKHCSDKGLLGCEARVEPI